MNAAAVFRARMSYGIDHPCTISASSSDWQGSKHGSGAHTWYAESPGFNPRAIALALGRKVIWKAEGWRAPGEMLSVWVDNMDPDGLMVWFRISQLPMEIIYIYITFMKRKTTVRLFKGPMLKSCLFHLSFLLDKSFRRPLSSWGTQCWGERGLIFPHQLFFWLYPHPAVYYREQRIICIEFALLYLNAFLPLILFCPYFSTPFKKLVFQFNLAEIFRDCNPGASDHLSMPRIAGKSNQCIIDWNIQGCEIQVYIEFWIFKN